MKMLRMCSVLAAPVLAVSPLAQAANITSLSVGDAVMHTNSPTTEGIAPAADRSLGHTVYAAFTPSADDLTGTLLLFEYGGTSNGFNIGLVDGVFTYMAKHNSGDQYEPAGLNDTELRPDASTNGEISVQSSFGALTAGTAYDLAVSWDQAGTLLLGVQDATAGTKDAVAITGTWDNWAGNNSHSVAVVYNSPGGYATELEAFGDADNPAFDSTYLKLPTGTVSEVAYWNAAGDITVVPEPTSLALAGLGLGLCARRRRR